MKTFIKLCFLSLILVTISCNQDSLDIPFVDIENDNQFKSVNSKSTVPVGSPLLTVNGTSTLHRNKKGITVNFNTDGLIPGHAVTLWWVIWNNPENCTTPYACGEVDFGIADQVGVEVLYAAGHVIGGNGMGNFSARLNLNDDSESINDLFGLPAAGGLVDAQKAEVHLVIRSHGPMVPGLVKDQIGAYVGGCDDPFKYDPFTSYPDVIGECADIIASIHASTMTP